MGGAEAWKRPARCLRRIRCTGITDQKAMAAKEFEITGVSGGRIKRGTNGSSARMIAAFAR